jgi:DNA-binding transcriptional ArsR family regulator
LSEAKSRPYTFDPGIAAKLLNAMSNPVRLGILERVSLQEWDVNALATDLNMSQLALSQHLFRLRAAKLVKTRRSAQQILYSSDSVAVLSMLATLAGLGLARREPVQYARRAIRGRKFRIKADAA